MARTSDDPIRAEVERALHAVVDLTVVLPLRVATAIPRCVLRRATRSGPLAEPLRVLRSLLELAGGAGGRGVVAPDDAPAPDEPALAAVVPTAPLVDDAPPPDLPIEDYESLAASHVVDRLTTLTPAELHEVREFETAHRGRRTVLGRIEQLLA